MTTGACIAAAARGFVGTPFHHQGRAPGAGMDCVGVAVLACGAAGRQVVDFTAYGRVPRGTLMPACEARFMRVQRDPEVGDLIAFWILRPAYPWHVGVCVAPGRMVHAFGSAGFVCEQDITQDWTSRIVAVFDMTRAPSEVIGG
ncbi:MAG: NlpC/P60 family protein [bacterium]